VIGAFPFIENGLRLVGNEFCFTAGYNLFRPFNSRYR
jgi:hypothetical protein